MKVFTDISSVSIKKPVVTIGVFDGVHCGHAFIIQKLNEKARELNGESTIITLWPHPRIVLEKADKSLLFLSTIEEKKELMALNGLQNLLLLPFTREFSQLTSKDFIEKYLAKGINASHLILGHNHRFGNDREGNVEKIREYCMPYGIGVDQLTPVSDNEKTISSSLIRKLILSGEVDEANKYLGYTFFVRGKVMHGNKMGRKLGYATANLGEIEPHKITPAIGVYAVRVKYGAKTYDAMLNIGYRPTIEDAGKKQVIEAHIFNFSADIYGKEIEVQFVSRIRDEKKFGSLNELREALHLDKERAQEILAKKH